MGVEAAFAWRLARAAAAAQRRPRRFPRPRRFRRPRRFHSPSPLRSAPAEAAAFAMPLATAAAVRRLRWVLSAPRPLLPLPTAAGAEAAEVAAADLRDSRLRRRGGCQLGLSPVLGWSVVLGLRCGGWGRGRRRRRRRRRCGGFRLRARFRDRRFADGTFPDG